MGTGNKLKQLLKEKKITVAELSRKTKISAQTLYSIINRDSSISYENLLLLSKALEIDIIELSDFKKYQQDVIANSPALSAMKKLWGNKGSEENDLYQDALTSHMIKALDITEDKQELLYIYNQLNNPGKKEAIKRLNELTELNQYTEIKEAADEVRKQPNSLPNVLNAIKNANLKEGEPVVLEEQTPPKKEEES